MCRCATITSVTLKMIENPLGKHEHGFNYETIYYLKIPLSIVSHLVRNSSANFLLHLNTFVYLFLYECAIKPSIYQYDFTRMYAYCVHLACVHLACESYCTLLDITQYSIY